MREGRVEARKTILDQLSLIISVFALAVSIISCRYTEKTYDRQAGLLTGHVQFLVENPKANCSTLQAFAESYLAFTLVNKGSEPIERINFKIVTSWLWDSKDLPKQSNQTTYEHRLTHLLPPGEHITIDLKKEFGTHLAKIPVPPERSMNMVNASLLVTASPQLHGQNSPGSSEMTNIVVQFVPEVARSSDFAKFVQAYEVDRESKVFRYIQTK